MRLFEFIVPVIVPPLASKFEFYCASSSFKIRVLLCLLLCLLYHQISNFIVPLLYLVKEPILNLLCLLLCPLYHQISNFIVPLLCLVKYPWFDFIVLVIVPLLCLVKEPFLNLLCLLLCLL